jgi:hypothetical protein
MTVLRVSKSRIISGASAEHVAHTGELRNAYNILVGKSKERGHLGYRDAHGRIRLKWTSNK